MISSQNERLYVSEFMSLFIAALVLRGKTMIYKRGEHSLEERDRMYALYKHVRSLLESADRNDKKWCEFLHDLRWMLHPGDTGSFSDFYSQFLMRWGSHLSIDLMHCNHYDLVLRRDVAQVYLDRASARMRECAEKAADVYVAEVARYWPRKEIFDARL